MAKRCAPAGKGRLFGTGLRRAGEVTIVVVVSLSFPGPVTCVSGLVFCAEVEHQAPSPQHQPFMPVVAMPWMKVFCAMKNSAMTGAMTMMEAAIRSSQEVPPERD